MLRRALPFAAALLILVGLVLTLVWAWWLVSSRPTVTGFSDRNETCYAVIETPNGGLHGHPRRQYSDQAELNGLQEGDALDVTRLTDDCGRARLARVALLAGAAVPTGLILLVGAVVAGVGVRRSVPPREVRPEPELRDPASLRATPDAGEDQTGSG